MSKRRFEGQVAVVTGGSMGIGRATVLQLAAEGAHGATGCFLQPSHQHQQRGFSRSGRPGNGDKFTVTDGAGNVLYTRSNDINGSVGPLTATTDANGELNLNSFPKTRSSDLNNHADGQAEVGVQQPTDGTRTIFRELAGQPRGDTERRQPGMEQFCIVGVTVTLS